MAEKKKIPAKQGRGRGGVPPVEHRFKPGESGNPKGRPPNAGATLREWVNLLAGGDATEDELRRMARDKRLPWTKRAACERILRTLEAGDLADFAEVVSGQKTLVELKKAGVNTEMVKKLKVGKEGEVEIELHDRAGEDFDRICDRTDGRPTQRVDVKHDGTLRTNADGQAAADQILDRVAQRLGVAPGGAGADQPDP